MQITHKMIVSYVEAAGEKGGEIENVGYRDWSFLFLPTKCLSL